MKQTLVLSLFSFLFVLTSCSHQLQRDRSIASDRTEEEQRLRRISHLIGKNSGSAINLQSPLKHYLGKFQKNKFIADSSIEDLDKKSSKTELRDGITVAHKTKSKKERSLCKGQECIVLEEKIEISTKFDVAIDLDDYKAQDIPVIFKKINVEIQIESPKTIEDGESVTLLVVEYKEALTADELSQLIQKAKENRVSTGPQEVDRL